MQGGLGALSPAALTNSPQIVYIQGLSYKVFSKQQRTVARNFGSSNYLLWKHFPLPPLDVGRGNFYLFIYSFGNKQLKLAWFLAEPYA